MRRVRLGILALGVLGLTAWGLAGACGRGDGPQLDLILISVDTLRADRLPFYGGPRDTGGDPAQEFTPSWLAAQGTVFDNVWATAGQTLPSLGSFWTGQPPLEHGGIANDQPVILPTRLSAWKGKRFDAARALLMNPSLGPGCGLQASFDTYGVLPKGMDERLPAELLKVTQADVQAQKRLLVWAHLMSPHQPYEPPAAAADRYGAQGLRVAGNDFLFDIHRRGAMKPLERTEIEKIYDAEVFTASGLVREILAGLDAQYRAAGRGGLLENAIVVFFSDHGEALGDHHGYAMHAKSLYTGVIRVPLVIVGPGWKAARDAQALGLEEVLPWLIGARRTEPRYFHAAWRAEFYSVRDERWTLVHNPSGNPQGPREPPLDAPFPYPALALYDRQADPTEQKDVSAQHPEEARRLLQSLNDWYASLLFASDAARSSMTAQQLAELGYAASQEQAEEVRLSPHPAHAWQPSPPPR
jgi:hypothetical protein